MGGGGGALENPPSMGMWAILLRFRGLFLQPPQEWSAVDTAVSNQVQVLSLNSLLWPSGYLFLRMESIWYYYELLLLISVIRVCLY